MNKPVATAYVPGTCNINLMEIAYRKKVANIATTIAMALLIILLLLGASRWFRLLLLPLFVIAMSCYQQAHYRFCNKYGAAGLQNADEGSAEASKVENSDAIQADKQRSSQMNRRSIVGGIALTILTLLIPEY